MHLLGSLVAVAFGASVFLGFANSANAGNDGGAKGHAAKTEEASQRIDALLAEQWAKDGVKPNGSITDEVFVRRIYLDIVGRIPSAAEAQEFLSSRKEGKRAELIDRLLAGEGYVLHAFNFWADILRAQSSGYPSNGITSARYVEYLKESLRSNKPYDVLVRELVAAQGKTWENPAVGYYMRDRGMPLDNMANTSRIFLGTRMECAQCHNHPFDKWTQMQFFQMAAFTYGVEANYPGIGEVKGALDLYFRDRNQREAKAKNGTEAERAAAAAEQSKARWVGKALDDLGDRVRYVKVQFLPKKELRLPHDYSYSDAKPKSEVKPATVLGASVETPAAANLPEIYARWMTSPENPRFTKVIANRLWKRVFGAGIIEPVDDIQDSTVPSHPALLQYLEELMVQVGYDMKAYQRALYNTRAYQSAAVREEIGTGQSYHFSGPLLRRMSAEQIWDSFVTLIHAPADEPRDPPGAREIAVRTAQSQKISDALDLLTAEELYEGALKASEKYNATAARSTELKAEFAAAQKAKDKERMSVLGAEISFLDRKGRDAANQALVVPAVARLYTKVTGAPAPEPPAAAEGAEPAMAAMMMNGANARAMKASIKANAKVHNYITVPGYDVPEETEDDRQAEQAKLREKFAAEAARLGIADGDRKAFIETRLKHDREWRRAAQIESPAPRGHYLREFGQSDREVIENANKEASVPQALALMNSRLFPEVSHRFSQLMLNVTKAATPEAQVDEAYLALLARPATTREKEIWAGAREKGLNSVEDLVYALINTQQFIFIQ